MKKLFYFAFGSNMYQKRLELRVGHLGKIINSGTHRLHGYKLAFNCNSGISKISYANIVPASDKEFVEGVLYELNDEQISSLNRFEGYPYAYQQRFFVLPNDEIGFAYVSTDKHHFSKYLPELEYLNICIVGAYENNLMSTYNMLVDFKNNNYVLKKGNKFKKK